MRRVSVRATRSVTRLSRMAMAAGLLLVASASLQAMTLAEAFEAAQAHDPQYRSALHDLEAARQGIPIARASLLPVVSLNYSNLGYSGTREFPNALAQEVTTRLDYAAPQTSLSMRVPLFNYEAWSRLDQATAQTRGAEANYRARGLDLVDRLTSAYLQALEARALRMLTDAEVVAMLEQNKRAEQRLRRGEGTRTEEAQARAALEVARARAGDATERVVVADARLQRLTGQMPRFVQDTPASFRPQPSSPSQLRDWMTAGAAQNPVIEVRQAAVEAARFGIKRNQAGHLPRLDLVANVARARNESISNLDQSTNLRSIGVQLSVPIFSGFGVQASIRQSEAELLRAEEELRNERENNELEIRRLLQASDSAAVRAEALRRAIEAGETAVTGTTRAQEAGLATQSDVLDARSRLYSTRRDLAQSLYDHLAARMRVMVLAGEPMQRIIEQVGAELVERIPLSANEPTATPR